MIDKLNITEMLPYLVKESTYLCAYYPDNINLLRYRISKCQFSLIHFVRYTQHICTYLFRMGYQTVYPE